MIQRYFSEIEKIISEFPNIRFYTLTQKVYNNCQGCISGSIVFDNNHRLDFVEVKNTDLEHKIKYRYHYMDDRQEIIFRYDNAPHHNHILTFPHHKHENNQIKLSNEPNLDEILLEITRLQR
ncbi:hypothetical protein IQ219_15190 [Synechocystis sp. LEGE 06083]|uniref:toxin-antitoxin system TumE family protein n=1 Tax=Synechocystis sp. LEGE 06083 TaxID=915336 RepID=UPI00187EC826|nr:DUF6516 family protein [Synechocystis sp. LEGE 06083]MBE9196619.1 hypothetical protein [Synechocystis sp. LEGE 06083]